jgi:hypothetical protein
MVSSYGRVKRLVDKINGRIEYDVHIPQRTAQDGRRYVSVTVDRKCRRLYVHRLVAEAFVPNPHGNLVVVLRDPDADAPLHYSNLEWVTHATIRARNPRPQVLPPEERAKIRARLAGGERGADIAREYGVSPSYISLIKDGLR